MKVIATRFFISQIHGNVDEGDVLDVSDAKGKSLIDSGLVKVAPFNETFPRPVEATVPMSSLQAAPASPNKIVKGSELGKPKPKARKRKSQ